jgi:hypothetical protein
MPWHVQQQDIPRRFWRDLLPVLLLPCYGLLRTKLGRRLLLYCERAVCDRVDGMV